MQYLRVNLVALSLLVACFVGVTPSAAIGQVSIGQGMNAPVFALAVNGTDVYAGGYFTTAGGVSANGIAKWDGTTWAALGTGMNGYVDALAVSGTDLYMAGYFTTAGGVNANSIAKWNGTTWAPLGTGINGQVFALAVRHRK